MAGKSSFSDFKIAAGMRDVITQIVRSEVDRIRPESRIAQVKSINAGNLTAEVSFSGDEGSFNARFGLSLMPKDTNAIVRVAGTAGNYYITEIVNQAGGNALYEPILEGFNNGDFISPPVTDGLAPSTAPVLTATAAIRSIALKWTEVDNADFTTYAVYVGASSPVAVDPASLYGVVAGTSVVVTAMPNGTPLSSTLPTFFKVVPLDRDGEGPASNEVSATPRLIETIDFGPGSVNAAAIAEGSVTSFQLANLTISTIDLADGVVQASKLIDDAVIANKIFNSAVLTAKLADASVAVAKIADTAVITAKLADNALTVAKVADNAIGNAEVIALAMDAAKLATDAVTSVKITADAVTSPKIVADAITASELAVNSVTAADVLANTMTALEINASAITASELAIDSVTAADVLANTMTALEINASAITASELAVDSVTAADMLAGTVTATQIFGDTITANKIATNAIGVDELLAGAVIAGDIAANAVTASELAAGSITATDVLADTMTANEIATNAVTAFELAAGSIVAGDLLANAVTAGTIAALAVTTGTLAADSVTADKLDAYAITAKHTLTGPTIQTATSGNRALLNLNGLFFIGSGGAQSNIWTDSTGRLQLQGPNATATVYLRADGQIDFGGNQVNCTPNFACGNIYGTGSVYLSGASSSFQHTAENRAIFWSAGDMRVVEGTNSIFTPIRASAFIVSSTRDVKKNIVNTKYGMKQLMQLRSTDYEFKDVPGRSISDEETGLIVEEVYPIYPPAVALDPDGKPTGLDYGKFTPLLIRAIQELKAEVDELKKTAKPR